MQLKHGHIGKKISGDWRLLRCGCGERRKRSAGETWKQMKRYYKWYGKRSLMDVICRRKKNWVGHILRGESLLREMIEGRRKKDQGEGNDWVCWMSYWKNRRIRRIKEKGGKTGNSGEHGSQLRTCLYNGRPLTTTICIKEAFAHNDNT